MDEVEILVEKLWTLLRPYYEADKAHVREVEMPRPGLNSSEVQKAIVAIAAEGEYSEFAQALPALQELEANLAAYEDMVERDGNGSIPADAHLRTFDLLSHLLKKPTKTI